MLVRAAIVPGIVARGSGDVEFRVATWAIPDTPVERVLLDYKWSWWL
jgi:hypothetical protein